MRVKSLLVVTFLIALLLPSSLFSYEISFNKKFTKSVTPDFLSTNINVTIENKSEKFINKHIEKFNEYIKNNNLVEKNQGSFTLSPKYNYFKNTQKFVGYVGSLRYTVKSKNAKNINEFINDLIDIENKFAKDNVKLRISNVSWTTSNKLLNESLDVLRIEAMTWIEAYAQSLKNVLSKNCIVKNININKVNNQFLRTNKMESYSLKRASNVTPINSNQVIRIEPNFIMECR